MPRPYQPATTMICENPACAKEFTASPGDRRWSHRYCSRPCATADAHRRQGHGPAESLPCEVCGAPVLRYPSQAKQGRAYCSRAHFYARKQEQPG